MGQLQGGIQGICSKEMRSVCRILSGFQEDGLSRRCSTWGASKGKVFIQRQEKNIHAEKWFVSRVLKTTFEIPQLTDTDTRYRRNFLDLIHEWKNPESIHQTFHKSSVRSFFISRWAEEIPWKLWKLRVVYRNAVVSLQQKTFGLPQCIREWGKYTYFLGLCCRELIVGGLGESLWDRDVWLPT